MDGLHPSDLAVQLAAAALARAQQALADRVERSARAKIWATAAAARAHRLTARGSDWPMAERAHVSCRRCGEPVTGLQEHVIDGDVHYHDYCFDRMLDDRRTHAEPAAHGPDERDGIAPGRDRRPGIPEKRNRHGALGPTSSSRAALPVSETPNSTRWLPPESTPPVD